MSFLERIKQDVGDPTKDIGMPKHVTVDREDLFHLIECLQGKTKSIGEFRAEFEDSARSCMFDVSRRDSGEYKNATFFFWAGYWDCAIKNGVLVGKDADFNNKDKVTDGILVEDSNKLSNKLA